MNNCERASKELRDLQEDVENKRQILREIEKKEQVSLIILYMKFERSIYNVQYIYNNKIFDKSKLLTRQKQSFEERLKRQRDKHRQRIEESEDRIATLQKDYERIQEEMKEYELKAAEEKKLHDEIQEKVCNFFLF